MVSFCAFWVVLFTVQLPVLHAKNGAFGLPELKLTVACAHAEMERETKTERERERDKRQSRNKSLSKVQIILH